MIVGEVCVDHGAGRRREFHSHHVYLTLRFVSIEMTATGKRRLLKPEDCATYMSWMPDDGRRAEADGSLSQSGAV